MNEQIVGLITPTMAVVFMFVFLVLWNRGRMGTYVLAFAASFFFFAIGFAATHLLDTGSPYIFHITQFFYVLSSACGIWGVAKRVGQPPYLGVLAIIYALCAATLAVAVSVSSDISSRLIIVNTGYGVMYLVSVMTLLGAHQREAIDKLIIFTQSLLAAQFLIRPVLTLLVESSIAADAYRQSLYYSIVNLSLSLISLTAAMVLVGACVYDMIKSVREGVEFDLLSGLRTRRSFEQIVVSQIEKAKLEGVEVSLVVADIDHFKSVNDVWGHQVGDQGIAAFGRVIDETIRDTDIAGRIGGEEFCVLAWNCDGEAAAAMAERIRKRFSATRIDGMTEDHRLTASFGVAERKEGEGYGKLFARSDAALYRAKQEGRNRTLRDGDDRGEATITRMLAEETGRRATS